MKTFRVELGGFQPWLTVNQGDLGKFDQTWTQQPGHFTLFFMEHAGVFYVNDRPHPYQRGNVAFCVPGVRFGFQSVGPNTHNTRFVMGLVSRTETVSIPAVADLGDTVELRRREVAESMDWLSISIMRGLSCAFNILWSIASPTDSANKSDTVFELERLIGERLSTKISVPSLAAELGISHSHLLRLFREEHACTIQEYVLDRRVQEARTLICESDRSLKEIAVRIGVPNLQYFNKIVRAGTGLSPRALRTQAAIRTRH